MEANQWIGQLKAFINQIPQKADDGLQEVTEQIFNDSQDNCPVKTGYLKESGAYSVKNCQAEIKYTADYAAVVHEGTANRTAKPFLQDAINKNLANAPNLFKKGWDK